ncbi:response regulator transcription factor [Anaeromicropila populeti]|uniref:Stage 0 sporulation protein A homolog n=1 Tax=Anaeromicropila populeti TaxID=37658 RepID=A0A1I6JAD6_9FIRM|nr:response regulator transcription factor [Anaeromicropila populeti]SFR75490.1 DNA-binding response regulator, OmpR family, contains REC and winged-helix (wHTH) domain [Anaeromicropila populeti]
MESILIIEDNKALSRGIRLAMEQSGYNVTEVHQLNQAKKILLIQSFSVILLDINLPDGNGIDFCRMFRKENHTPVIILTANDMELDEVAGLEAGADDYITKPFSLAVLRARIGSVVRRASRREEENKVQLDEFSFDFHNMVFTREGKEIVLSKTEQKLLKVLVENRGTTLSRERLLEKVWNCDEFIEENALSVTVKRLREKLGDTEPKYIKTIYGVGYVWNER